MQQIDRYQIEAELDSGGFGTVFRARHVVLGRRVALKLLHPSRESSLDIVERFLREARILSSIASPHVVQVVDAGMTNERQLFLAMELLDGMSLAARLQHQSPLTIHHALSITRQVAQGLAAAHAVGVVHRDLKPGNIFLTKTAEAREIAKVLDFGISKSQAREADNVITMTGAVLGTPHYMAPEQLHGARDVDARADIYSLTVCLYEMLSGRLPHAANTLEALLAQRLRDPPTPITTHAPRLPFELVTIIDRGLARDPDARFSNIAEFDAALGRLDPLPLLQTTPSQPVTHARPTPDRPTANARGRSAATAPAVSVTPWPTPWPPSTPPPSTPSQAPHPRAPRSLGNLALALLLGGAVITILILIAALVSVTALFVTRTPSAPNEPTTSPAPQPSPYVASPTIGPMVPVRQTPEPTSAPENGTSPSRITGPGVHAFVTRTSREFDTSPFYALFERATPRLHQCRRSVDDEVHLQVFVGHEGQLPIVQPDAARPHGHEETARCAASAIRDAGPLEQENAQGIVQVTVRLRAR